MFIGDVRKSNIWADKIHFLGIFAKQWVHCIGKQNPSQLSSNWIWENLLSSNGDFNSGGSVDCEGEVGDGEGGQKQVHLGQWGHHQCYWWEGITSKSSWAFCHCQSLVLSLKLYQTITDLLGNEGSEVSFWLENGIEEEANLFATYLLNIGLHFNRRQGGRSGGRATKVKLGQKKFITQDLFLILQSSVETDANNWPRKNLMIIVWFIKWLSNVYKHLIIIWG